MPAPLDVHVHVCAAGSAWERAPLLLRDYLREHRAEADVYAALKLELAEQWGDDRRAYTDGKSALLLDILDHAEAWALSKRWSVEASPD
jgi:GrpB-like predicted nucleotidyltransferase (UPF0157 family)